MIFGVPVCLCPEVEHACVLKLFFFLHDWPWTAFGNHVDVFRQSLICSWMLPAVRTLFWSLLVFKASLLSHSNNGALEQAPLGAYDAVITALRNNYLKETTLEFLRASWLFSVSFFLQTFLLLISPWRRRHWIFISHAMWLSVCLTGLTLPPPSGGTLAKWAAKMPSDTCCTRGICGGLS